MSAIPMSGCLDQTVALLDDATAQDPEAVALVLDELAHEIVDPAAPQAIVTAPRAPETPILLFCPEQGGWQVGKWWTVELPGRWAAAIDTSIRIEPTHWAPMLLSAPAT